MAGPIRFRKSTQQWSERRVRSDLLGPLDRSLGATMSDPQFVPPEDFQGCRFDMDNGDFALFLWRENAAPAYWTGNTETPETLWRTDKYSFGEVPYPVARWVQRVLLADLEEQDPWLASYRHVAWFFLPVFHSKDGRESTRAFFSDHSAGFPDADPDEAISFYEAFLRTGVLDPYREVMAGKLGTSPTVDLTRMSATMAEFTAAKVLYDAGTEFVPEAELDSGYALDFRVDGDILVEVTRPIPPRRRRADSPIAAVRQTAGGKTDTQLDAHPNAVLFVDCSSFPDDDWHTVRDERPSVGYRPALVYRARPNGAIEGFLHGNPPIDLAGAIRLV